LRSPFLWLLKLIEDNYLDPKRLLAIFCNTRKKRSDECAAAATAARVFAPCAAENALVVFSAIVRAAAKNWCVCARERSSQRVTARDTNLYLNGVTAKRSTAKLVSSLSLSPSHSAITLVRRAVKKYNSIYLATPYLLLRAAINISA